MTHKGERIAISSKSGCVELTPVSDNDKEIREHLNSIHFITAAKQAWEEHKQVETLKFESAKDAQK